MKASTLKWAKRILSIDLIIAVLCLTVLVVLTFIGSIARYFYRSPLAWQEEVQTWMILWTIFCGGSYAFRAGAHVSIDVITENFSPKWQTVIAWFGYGCTIAALGFFMYYSTKLNIQFFETNKVTTTLRIPSWKIYFMSSLGSLWMVLSITCHMVEKFLLRAKDKKEGGVIE